MSNYVIFTDSGSDIKPSILKDWGVKYLALTLRINGDDREYLDGEMDIKEFYDKMRAGSVAKTSAINVDAFYNAFKAEAEAGNDVMYIGFSSGLSTTCNSGMLAMNQLKSEYPERTFLAVDSLAASAGQGLLVKLGVDKKQSGASIQENCEYLESIKLNICHWFTVDDLVYLKRGGRISPTLAFVGNTLGLKPLLHVDNEGHLISMAKIKGRKRAIAALADKVGEAADDPVNGTIFISHGDCMSEVEKLVEILKTKYNATVDLITDVGAVIGAHAGPGVIAIFYVGRER